MKMENYPDNPVLLAINELKPEFKDFKKIPITSDTVSLIFKL